MLANAALTFLPTAARLRRIRPERSTGAAPRRRSSLPPYQRAEPTRSTAVRVRSEGVRPVGTLHADSLDEAVESLQDVFGLPAADIARVTLIAISRITRGEYSRRTRFQVNADIERRVVETGLLAPAAEGVSMELLTSWEPR